LCPTRTNRSFGNATHPTSSTRTQSCPRRYKNCHPRLSIFLFFPSTNILLTSAPTSGFGSKPSGSFPYNLVDIRLPLHSAHFLPLKAESLSLSITTISTQQLPRKTSKSPKWSSKLPSCLDDAAVVIETIHYRMLLIWTPSASPSTRYVSTVSTHAAQVSFYIFPSDSDVNSRNE
jgi:hypothetical protein